jgi:hypothetical protein
MELNLIKEANAYLNYHSNNYITEKISDTKLITIKKTRKGKDSFSTGTLEQLKKDFSYTLDSGWSYNHKINTNPRNGKALEKALNQSTDETQKGNFDPNYYQLIDTTDEMIEAYAKNNNESITTY